MPRGKNPTLTEAAALGLFFIQRYRFLTIDQFARIANLNRSTASGQLRFLERQGFLHHFHDLAGYGLGRHEADPLKSDGLSRASTTKIACSWISSWLGHVSLERGRWPGGQSYLGWL